MEYFNKLMYDLHTIGGLAVGQKLSVYKDRICVDRSVSYQFVCRAYNNDSRATTIARLRGLVESVNFLIDMCCLIVRVNPGEIEYAPGNRVDHWNAPLVDVFDAQPSPQIVAGIRDNLLTIAGAINGAIRGLTNLIITYNDDNDAKYKLSDIVKTLELARDKAAAAM